MAQDAISVHFGIIIGTLKTLGAPIESVRSIELLQREMDELTQKLFLALNKEIPVKAPAEEKVRRGWGAKSEAEKKAQSIRMKKHWAKKKKDK